MNLLNDLEELEAYLELFLQDKSLELIANEEGAALDDIIPQANLVVDDHIIKPYESYEGNINVDGPTRYFIQASNIEETIDDRTLSPSDSELNEFAVEPPVHEKPVKPIIINLPDNGDTSPETPLSESFTYHSIPTAEAFKVFDSSILLGSAVAINGNNVLIGASDDDTGDTNSGAAYLYDLTTGNLLLSFINPAPAADDEFGNHVAISEDYIVISGYLDDTGETDAGSIYVYDVATGNLLHTINNPTPVANDTFGFDVSISGNYIIATSPNNDSGSFRSGSAYVYDAATGTLLHTLDNPTPLGQEYFGYTVASSGNYAIFGALYGRIGTLSSGQAHIFDLKTGNLLHNLDNPTPDNFDYFGRSVAMSGNYAVVGASADGADGVRAGMAYVYDVTTGNLLHTLHNPTPNVGDSFGYATAAHNKYVLVGEMYDDADATNAGAVHVFDLITGNLVETIHNPEAGIHTGFGLEISITGNATTINTNIDGISYTIHGDFDNDGIVTGSALNNVLYGLDGDDVLTGLAGNDTLYGGSGADTFSFDSQGAGDMDRIEDFSAAEGDILDISDLLTGYSGSDDITDFVRIIDDTVNTGNAYLMIDSNGAADNSLDFTSVAYIVNGAGLDISTLFDNGQVIA